MFEVFSCLTDEHDLRRVALAAAVCFFASAVAISFFHRAQAAKGHERWVWLSLDAIAVGYGIWATHFISLLAYNHAFGAGYSLALTIISLLASILITGAGLVIAGQDFRPWPAAIGGAVIGLGIAAMHFIGVIALALPGHITWSPILATAAIVFGTVFASLALLVAATRKGWLSSLGASLLTTLAVLSTHFTGMGAMRFVPDPALIFFDETSLSRDALSILLAGAAALVLGMCLVAALSDRQSKDRLKQQKMLLDAALENMSQGLCMYDAEGRVLMFNERYAKMTNFRGATLKGRSLLDLLKQRAASGHFDGDPETYFAELTAKLRQGQSCNKIIEVDPGRTLRIVDHPMRDGGWVATIEDITDWREAQTKISHMARHDALTDLPNRTLFREQLEHALHRTTRDEQVAVLCLDLDHFKDVNDTLGHPVGDELLKAVARRLTECVRKGDTVARLGGDEFAIVQVGGPPQPSNSASLSSRLVEAIGSPYEIQGHQIIIGTSIGISVAPNDGCDPDRLLKNADMALYLAKSDGRGACRFFEPGMDARAKARRLLILDLRSALLRSEFEVLYQPIYTLETDRIICFEALVRWNHPLRGVIMPEDFIPIAEETGLIVPIGCWVLKKACMEAATWSQHVSVAVNLSPAQFKNRNLVPTIVTALSESGLAPHRLEIEITESVLLQETEATLAALHQIRNYGVRVSMDDFGTGYSSLSYLRSFPFDKIKIDQSFVHELRAQGDSMAIIRAVTGLGKSLGITTTAEGVETDEQLALLRAEGCSEVQGFLFSKPQPAAKVEQMLSRAKLRSIA